MRETRTFSNHEIEIVVDCLVVRAGGSWTMFLFSKELLRGATRTNMLLNPEGPPRFLSEKCSFLSCHD